MAPCSKELMECGNAHYPPLTHEGAASGWNPTWTGSVWMWLELKKVEAMQKVKLNVVSWLFMEPWECCNSHGVLAEALG